MKKYLITNGSLIHIQIIPTLIIIFVLYYIYNHYYNYYNSTENFTPAIRELYRPYVRNARIMSEGFYSTQSSNMSNLFRKFGIL
jgi:hypothetical protein